MPARPHVGVPAAAGAPAVPRTESFPVKSFGADVEGVGIEEPGVVTVGEAVEPGVPTPGEPALAERAELA